MNAEISSSRDQSWAGITSREHRVSQVFSASAKGLDLMLSGTMKMVKDDGEESVTTYACHFKADQASVNDGRARLTYAHVYVVSVVPCPTPLCNPLLLYT